MKEMDIPTQFYRSFVEGVGDEIRGIQASGVLGQKKSGRNAARTLNCNSMNRR